MASSSMMITSSSKMTSAASKSPIINDMTTSSINMTSAQSKSRITNDVSTQDIIMSEPNTPIEKSGIKLHLKKSPKGLWISVNKTPKISLKKPFFHGIKSPADTTPTKKSTSNRVNKVSKRPSLTIPLKPKLAAALEAALGEKSSVAEKNADITMSDDVVPSIEDPETFQKAVLPDTTNDDIEQWQCADRACNTGQTLLDRSKYGRKVVSDFFGRNKRETKEIHPDVWHMMCRKSYQRNKYNAEKGGPKVLCEFYLEYIKAQLQRIQLWRPDATFSVQLEKPAKERLNHYHEILRRNGGDVGEAKAQVVVAQKMGTKGKPRPLSLVDAVKVEHAEHLDAHFSGTNKTLEFLIDELVPWIEGEVERGTMVQMPPVEFLLNKTSAGEKVVDPASNYDRWAALVDGVDFLSPLASPSSSMLTASASASPPPPPRRRLPSPTSLAAKRNFESLPLWQPPTGPPPVAKSVGEAPNRKPWRLVSPATTIRGMAYSGSTMVRGGKESEADCESPLAEESKV